MNILFIVLFIILILIVIALVINLSIEVIINPFKLSIKLFNIEIYKKLAEFEVIEILRDADNG